MAVKYARAERDYEMIQGFFAVLFAVLSTLFILKSFFRGRDGK